MKTAKTANDELFNAFEDALLSEGLEGKDAKEDVGPPPALGESGTKQTGTLSPSTPLYDEDISQPLAEWKPKFDISQGWEFFLRWPNKKKFTGMLMYISIRRTRLTEKAFQWKDKKYKLPS